MLWVWAIIAVVVIIAMVVIIIASTPPGPDGPAPSGDLLGQVEPLDELSSPGSADIYQTQGPSNCAFDQGPCAYNIVKQDEYTCTFNKAIDSRGIAPGSHFDARCTRADGMNYTGRFRWQT